MFIFYGFETTGIRDRWHADEAPWTTFAQADAQIEEIRQAGAMNDQQLEALQDFYDATRAGNP